MSIANNSTYIGIKECTHQNKKYDQAGDGEFCRQGAGQRIGEEIVLQHQSIIPNTIPQMVEHVRGRVGGKTGVGGSEESRS